jgi:hypothetical protein
MCLKLRTANSPTETSVLDSGIILFRDIQRQATVLDDKSHVLDNQAYDKPWG